jgi:predicted kinase
MQAVILIGLPGAGKTTFYRQQFFERHVRISLDMLRTRNRERILLDACLAARQPFVVDSTNVRRGDRTRYIQAAKARGFRIMGYYFPADIEACLSRNAKRADKPAIPVAGVLSKYKQLEPPARNEGFDELYNVRVGAAGQFVVEKWPDDISAPEGGDRG